MGEINKASLFKLSYGLYILTSENSGCIINTASQLTDSPLTISVTVNKNNATHNAIKSCKKLNISVLSESATFDLFKHFGFQSSRDVDKFHGFDFKALSENDLYYITKGTNAFYSANVINEVDCGTHTLFIAEITEALELSEEKSATYDYYHKNIKPAPEEKAKGKWVCKICGYVYEGDELPADFICPWCQHPASDFERQGAAADFAG